MKDNSFMNELNKEIDNRIAIMEKEDFVGVPRMKKNDYCFSVVLEVISAIILVFTYHFMC